MPGDADRFLLSIKLQALSADFAHSTHSPTRRDALRPKDWLHLSLAYGFPPERHGPLARLARELVDISAPVQWESCFYERHEDGAWQMDAVALPRLLGHRHGLRQPAAEAAGTYVHRPRAVVAQQRTHGMW